jgi:hypothetical protein
MPPQLRLQAQVLLYVLGQGIVDFAMARDRLFLAGGRIMVDVVPSAVPQKDTALLFTLTNQFAAFHSAISLVL